MTTDTKQKCVSCEEVFEDGDHTYSNVKDGVLCYGCQEDDLQSASSLVLVHGGEINSCRIGNYVIYDDDLEIPDFFKDLCGDGVDVRKWTQTDGWRGHGSTIDNFKNVKVIAQGWTTGWADETTQRKAKFNGFLNEIADGSFPTPYPFYVLTEQTSNVFSQSVDVFTTEHYESRVIAWLHEIGYPQSTLKEWLS
jgi:hypothetical protein